MNQPEQHARSTIRREPEWLISPELPAGARPQLNSILDSDQLTPEVLGLLSKFLKEVQELERRAPAAADPCPKLDTCQDYHKPCTVLTYCGTFSVKAAAF